MGEIKRCQMLIDGEWVSASDGAVFPSVSPVTGAVWAEVPEATAADVDRAVRAADRALSLEACTESPPESTGSFSLSLAPCLQIRNAPGLLARN